MTTLQIIYLAIIIAVALIVGSEWRDRRKHRDALAKRQFFIPGEPKKFTRGCRECGSYNGLRSHYDAGFANPPRWICSACYAKWKIAQSAIVPKGGS